MKLLIIVLLYQVYLSQCEFIDREFERKINESKYEKFRFAKERLDRIYKQQTDESRDPIADNIDIDNLVDNMDLSEPQNSDRDMSFLNDPNKHVKKFMEDLSYQGMQELMAFSKYLETHCSSTGALTSALLKGVANCKLLVEHHNNMVEEESIANKLDMDYLMLHTLESFYAELYTQKALLRDEMIKNKKHNVTETHLKEVSDTLLHGHVQQKKRDMNLICKKYYICRPFPAFSDYFADFINEILMIPSNKIIVITEHFTEFIQGNEKFFETILDENTLQTVSYELKEIARDAIELKELLTIIRSILDRKYKLILGGYGDIMLRAKAVKMLIEIIDMTMSRDYDDNNMVILFDNVTNAVKVFALNKRADIREIVNNFANYFIDICKYLWDDQVKDDLNTLIQIIVFGKANNVKKQQTLLTSGSYFIHGTHFTPLGLEKNYDAQLL